MAASVHKTYYGVQPTSTRPLWTTRVIHVLLVIAALCAPDSAVFAQGLGNIPPRFGSFETTIIVTEDTPIGTVIGNMTASDEDNQALSFRTDTDDTANLVRLSPPREVAVLAGMPATYAVDIILNSELDRDYDPKRRTLYFTVTDGSSPITIWITLFIRDVNDVEPQFVNLPYEVTISENTPNGSTIYTRVFAKDPDNGQGVIYSMQSKSQNADPDYANTFTINPYNGNISLTRPLDYEKHSYYQFLVMAKDEGNKTAEPAGFVVYVLDVQDSPPLFVNLPYSVEIDEDTLVGTSIQQVTAIDGDTGIPNVIRYSFVEGDYENFDMDPDTGEITIKTDLDRDSDTMRNTGGVYAMTVQASEVLPQDQVNTGETTATTLVTITVKDVNDNGPVFSQTNYEASILENMQQDVPVGFRGSIMRVSDIDQGTNSHFVLTFQKDGAPYNDFAPLPQEIYSESSVLIRVNNSTALDYEVNQQVIFEVVATEVDTANPKSSSATVTIDIEDMNDNAPNFPQNEYSLDVFENTNVGTSLETFTATDLDSNEYGSIQYSLRGGNGRFMIEPESGILRVNGSINREENPKFYLTVEAKDGGGLRTPAEIVVTVKDRNDNNPQFRRSDYEGIVREQDADFVRLLQVEAFDDDEANTPNSQVSYRIVNAPNGLMQNFTINSVTGQITLTEPLDYEELNPALKGKVTLTVEAYDAGSPIGKSQVFVNITVEDRNDFTPKFMLNEYIATIPENASEGFLVSTVHATDLDGTSPNHDFIYRIESGALDKFRIDFETGQVEVEKRANLNREFRDEYILTISAIDRGTPPLAGNCTLRVTLTDINDEIPVFNEKSASKDLSENTTIGTTFYNFAATDEDLDHLLDYSIEEVIGYKSVRLDETVDIDATGVKDYFRLNRLTGDVSVNEQLEWEIAEKIVLLMKVEDLNAQSGQQTATGTLTVILVDSNDNPPEFPSSNFNVNVSESQSVDFIVLQVTTKDKDDSQSVVYSIQNDALAAFKIGADGTIRLANTLNREDNTHVNFEVVAKDNGIPQQSSTATVHVLILDANDNKPEFDPNLQVNFDVSEDAMIGFSVTRITATDQDAGDFGTVHYMLAGPDIEDGSFEINSETGEITVAKPLNWEDKNIYRFEVVAFDSLQNPDLSETTRSKGITINIDDVNDNEPVFKLVSPEFPQVSETSAVDQTVATVTAEDADDPNTKNGRVLFSLTSDTNATLQNGRNMFKINPNTGVITTANSLEGNAGIYYMTVQATNEDSNFSPTYRVFVKIVDVNDDEPRFIYPNVDNATRSVKENAPAGEPVITLVAEDNDQGLNGKILFSILPLPSSDKDGSSLFAVNETTGLITTLEPLNAEVQDRYDLLVQARDQGFPKPYSTTLTLLIVVLDQNDHEPKFDNVPAPQKIKMTESTTDSTALVNLATDADINSDLTAICYYLLSADLVETFLLDVTTGVLSLNKTLDRETYPVVNVVVQASSDCYLTVPVQKLIMGDNNRPVLYDPGTQDTMWFEIEVEDVNDNRPYFKTKDLAIGVTRATSFGKAILNLTESVGDLDTRKWGVDRFEKDGDFEAFPEALKRELDGLSIKEPFLLTRDGLIKTNIYFQPQMSGYFNVKLKVYDKGNFSDTATLRISLINDDQRLIVIFRQPIEQIEPEKDIIAKKLSDKVGFRVVVDSVQTHETETGQADVAKTDMFIHGEDFETNEVIPAESIIDQKNALLTSILNEYYILEIELTYKNDLDDNLEDKLKTALILTAVVLGSICIILAVVLYYMHRKYERRLKAATAMAYVNSGVEPNGTDLYKGDIPGTNIHSYENSNPIFLEKMSSSQDDVAVTVA